VIKFLIFAQRFLLKQRKEESVNLKRRLKKDIDCNFVSSGEEDFDDNESDEDSDINMKNL